MLSGLLSVDGWCEIVCVDLDCWRCCRISVNLSSVISIFWSDFDFIFDSHHFCIPWIFLGFCPDLIFFWFGFLCIYLVSCPYTFGRWSGYYFGFPSVSFLFWKFLISEHINHLVKAILVDLFVQVGAVPKTRNPRRNPNFNGVQSFSLRSRYGTTEYWSSYFPFNIFVTRKTHETVKFLQIKSS